MVTMLIFNVVLIFLDLARCASTSSSEQSDKTGKRYYIPYNVNSGSSSEGIQAGTTSHSIPSHVKTSVGNYNPYHRNAPNIPTEHREISHSTKIPSQPILQSGFQAILVPAPTNHVSEKVNTNNSPFYGQQARNPFGNNAFNGLNSDTSYLGYPSSYRLIPETPKFSGQLRSTSFPIVSGTFPPFAKYKSSATFNPATEFRTHSPPTSGFSQSFNAAPAYHRSNNQPIAKNIHSPTSALSSEITSDPSVKSFQKPGQIYHGYEIPKNVDYPGKKSPLTVHSSPVIVSGLVNAFENEPIILNPGHDYQTQSTSSLGPNFEYTKALSLPLANSPGSFVPSTGNYQPRVLPIHSSTSTSQIPHYKAASVNGFYTGTREKSNEYQPIVNQPQLHFNTGSSTQKRENKRQPVVYHEKPFGEFRTDVELINKKTTTTPSSYDSEETNFDQDHKAGGDFGYSNGYASENSRPTMAPGRSNNFELPRSNLFNSYDEAFGKYAKLASVEQDTREKRPTIDETTKPVYQSIEENDDEDNDGKSASGEYRESYTGEKDGNGSYEDEDEAESRRNTRQGYYDEKERRNDDDDENEDDDGTTASYRSYGKDFEKEFEESYRKDPPKNDYVHVKEVPEIEETRSESRKHPTNRTIARTSRGGTRQKSRHHTHRDDSKLPKKYVTQTSQEYVNPKQNYRDNDGHESTSSSHKWTDTTPSQLEDSYGYKIPRDRGTTRHDKIEDSERTKRANEKTTKQTVEDSDPRFSATNQASTSSSIDVTKPLNFRPLGSWKSSKKLTKERRNSGVKSPDVRAIFDTENSSYPRGKAHREGFSYLTNGQIIRDLTGI